MDSTQVDFGKKYKGELICNVPVEYLAYALRINKSPPKELLDELRERASRHGTRDSLEATAALADYEYRTRPNRKKKKKKTKNTTRKGNGFKKKRKSKVVYSKWYLDKYS